MSVSQEPNFIPVESGEQFMVVFSVLDYRRCLRMQQILAFVNLFNLDVFCFVQCRV